MRSPKGGKNKLTHNSPVKKVLKGKGAANPKIQKKEIKTKTIVEFLLKSVSDAKKALPKKPRLPLTKREKEILKVMRSIKKLGL